MPRAAACAKELLGRGIDAAQYTTAAWIEDLDAVRAALGYAKINLWGGSYGTRVALEYVRRHPDRVRSVVLDGVAPPSMIVNLDIWPSRDRALDAILERCAAAPSCQRAHPDLAATLASIRDRLLPAGRNVRVTDPRTGETQTMHLTFDHVIAALHAAHVFAGALGADAGSDRARRKPETTARCWRRRSSSPATSPSR